jgi:hypothetical protein
MERTLAEDALLGIWGPPLLAGDVSLMNIFPITALELSSGNSSLRRNHMQVTAVRSSVSREGADASDGPGRDCERPRVLRTEEATGLCSWVIPALPYFLLPPHC